MKQSIKKWLHDEWELTIFFPGETVEQPDGTKVSKENPQTFKVKKIKKISETHFVFIDTEGCKNTFKLLQPVGYHLKKVL